MQWPHLWEIKLSSISEKEVGLVIGTNVPDAFWVLEDAAIEENHMPYTHLLSAHSCVQQKE